MTVNYTTNLALGQPVTGTESGTWGDDVNNAVTSYLDIAIAGGLAVTVTTADVTLTLTQGTSSATNIGSTTAQYAILNVSGAMTAARNLIVPSSSRIYLINNNTTGGFALTVKGSATSGVTLVNGEKAHVFWNGTDYAKMSNSSGGAGVFSSITNTGLTSGRVVYSSAGGLETDSAGLTFDGTNFATTGTATATKLIPTGSSATGNGLYLPAANSVGISTNGTNAVYINASQNVGIGTSSPSNKLQVTDASAATIRLKLTANANGTIWNDNASTTDFTCVDARAMTFGTSNTERMRIDSSGNVGIGTSSGSARLNVNGGTSTSQIRWEVNNAAFTNEVSTNAAANAYVYKSNDASYHVWKVSSSEAMRLDSSGNVLIGSATSAGNTLRYFDIYNTDSGASAGAIIRLVTSNAAASGNTTVDLVKYKTGGFIVNNNETNAAAFTSFGVGASERMRIDSSGNVGIGLTNPSAALQVFRSGSTEASIKFNNGNASSGFVVGASTAGEGLVYHVDNQPIRFATNNTERMRIDSSGNVGIGTSSPAAKLNVIGGRTFLSANNETYSLGVQYTSSTGQYYIGATNSATPDLVFSNVGGTERMRLDNSGNVGIGTSSPITTSARLSVKAVGDYDAGLAIGSNASAANWARLDFKNTNVAYNGIIYQDEGGLFNIRNDGANAIAFSTNGGNERMRISSNGRVSIGTTNAPYEGLTILAGDAFTQYFNNASGVTSADGFTVGLASDNNAYVFNRENTNLLFGTNNSERMRIDSSGNVGIGTSSPAYRIDAYDSSGSFMRLYQNDGTYNRRLLITATSTGANAGVTLNATSSVGSDNFIFQAASIERMRIDSSGNLLVGTTSSTSAAKVTAVSDSAGAFYQMMMNNTDAGSGNQISMDIYRNSTRVGYISTTNLTCAFTSVSDYRLKEDVQPMQNALAKVALLKPVTYKWKLDGSAGQGFIAHELQEVVPDCVAGTKDALDKDGNINAQGIDTSFLVATLTAAIQEQQALITSLTARITALEST